MRRKIGLAAGLFISLFVLAPSAVMAQASSTTHDLTYVVKNGNTLYGIAQRVHVSVTKLESANPAIHGSRIYVGEKIVIPATKQQENRHANVSVHPTLAIKTAPQILADAILHTAFDLEGIRYDWGGTSPSTGFDCSGFIQYIFRQHGIALPRTASEQSQVGRPVSLKDLAPGDLMYFVDTYSGQTTDQVTHVALYIGNGNVIESSSVNNQGVIIIHNLLQNPWYKSRYFGSRDVIGE